MAGDMLADRYLLCGEAFSGRFLAAYAAEDIALGTRVEVDVLAHHREGFPFSVARLKELLEISLRMHGPHVNPLFAWWEEEGFLYAVMAASQGVALGELLRETGSLPAAQVVEVAASVVQVLSEAYGLGLYYLGLNPYQIFIGARGKVSLARAGFGWLLEEAEPKLLERASPYRAPETDGGREGTRVSDVFSLAVMLREMLPEEAVTDRLRSLLERAGDPLPQRRPSSPRLILEDLQAEVRLLHDGGGSRDGDAYVDRGPRRDDDPSYDTIACRSHGGSLGRGTCRQENASYGAGGGTGTPFLEADFMRPVGGEGVAAAAGYEKGDRRRGFLRLLALMLAGGLAAWLAFAAFSAFFSREGGGEQGKSAADEEIKVILPDLQGMTAEEAIQALEELGLSYEVRESSSRLWSAGRVVAQEPAEGSTLLPGELVSMVVSSGLGNAPVGAGGEAAPIPQGENVLSGSQPPAPPAGDATPTAPGDARSSAGRVAAGNSAPRAVASLSCHRGSAPLCVRMDAGGSCDPDGDIVRYLWRCGDGTTLEGVSVQHVFDSPVIPARFQVVLQVFDSGGASDTATAVVEVF